MNEILNPKPEHLPMEIADNAEFSERLTSTNSFCEPSNYDHTCNESFNTTSTFETTKTAFITDDAISERGISDDAIFDDLISDDNAPCNTNQISNDAKAKTTGLEDKLYRVLKAAAVGNVLDSAIGLDQKISGQLEAELEQPFAICDIDLFREKLSQAKSVLVIGDNAGETVFDGLMLKYLSLLNVQISYAVRHKPIINDAVMDDALAAGLNQYANLLSTGSDVPGIKLDECNKEFLALFENADLVISKGQGNYETLSDGNRDIFYLLKAKCTVVAHLLKVNQGDFVFKYIGDD